MPPAIIAAVIGAVATAAGTAVSVHEANESRDSSTAASNAATALADKQAATSKQESLAVAGPNAQSQTGGSLTGTGQSSFADILAGYAGQTGGAAPNAQATSNAVQQPTNASTQPSSGSGAPQSIQDLLALFQNGGGGNFYGGSGQPPTPDPNFSLSNTY